jgi:hypothetical protein
MIYRRLKVTLPDAKFRAERDFTLKAAEVG